jgi:hypothetical protein
MAWERPEKYSRVQDQDAWNNSPLWKKKESKIDEDVDPKKAEEAMNKALYPWLYAEEDQE